MNKHTNKPNYQTKKKYKKWEAKKIKCDYVESGVGGFIYFDVFFSLFAM